jgi:uncharacterized membrane protein YhaH (DUF805 family)
MEYMFKPLARMTDFSGRSRRKEYWMWVLFVMVGMILVSILDSMLGLGGGSTSYSSYGDTGVSAGFSVSGGILSLIFLLATLLPGIAVGIRRMHDTDHSGWWVLVPIVPLVFALTEGTRGPNRFGPDPKGADSSEVFA